MIWAIGILILTLTIDLVTDIRRYYQKRAVNHFRGAALRLVGFVPACVLYWPVVFLAPAYGVVFDHAYNGFIGQPLTFVGTTARWDKLQRKHGWLIVLKYVLAVAGLIVFIKW